jgi:hypothetical protein
MQAANTDNHAYNRKLRPLANKLRKEMTKAEASLWKYVLRARTMKGHQFRRQRPAITKHLKNIFETGELAENSVSSILEHTAVDEANKGTRQTAEDWRYWVTMGYEF